MAKAEAELRQLVSSAVLNSAPHAELGRLLEAVRALEGVRATLLAGASSETSSSETSSSETSPNETASTQSLGSALGHSTSGCFLRRRGFLVKVKDTYRHKVRFDLVVRLSELVAEATSGGSTLSSRSLLGAKAEDGTDLPRYSVYVVLNWLEHEGLIEKCGRGVYKRVTLTPLVDEVHRVWTKLE